MKKHLALPPGVAWTDANVEAWQRIYARFGQLRPVVVNRATMHLLSDPNELVALYRMASAGEPRPSGIGSKAGRWWAVAYLVDLPAELEPLACLVLAGGIDRKLAGRLVDQTALAVVMDLAAQGFDQVELAGISLDDLDEILAAVAGDEDSAPAAPPADERRNDWGIPELALHPQPVDLAGPVRKWGTAARSARHDGLYHFYTAVKKFTALLRDPAALVATGCRQAVELNLSTTPGQPRALQLYRVYQKRSVSQVWQRAGVQIWVDLNVDASCADLNLLGVPHGWRAYANRGYAGEEWHLEHAYERARERAGGEALYLVYGGGQRISDLCAARGWLWLPQDADSSRGRADGTR